VVRAGSSVHCHADTPAGLLADEEVLQIALRGSEGDVEGVGGEGAAAEELRGTLRGGEEEPLDHFTESPGAHWMCVEGVVPCGHEAPETGGRVGH